jgi:hypothetical protein
VYVLTSLIVMKHIATEMSITEPHSLHVVVSNWLPIGHSIMIHHQVIEVSCAIPVSEHLGEAV